MDHRTEEEFKRDIQEGTAIELDIILRYAHYVKRVYRIDIAITNNGCDNSGEFLAYRHVSTAVDYLINGKPAEIKFNKAKLSEFRLKAAQVESYVRQGASIILVNGYLSKQPKFTLITTKKLQEIMNTKNQKPFVGWGGKMCYVLNTSDFEWFNLDKLEDE
jgi:hypothetical protein